MIKRKVLVAILAMLITFGLAACSSGNKEAETTGFKPALDTNTSCQIVVVGSYNNFEALEAAFDHFNEYYPNVELTFQRLDDYNNIIGVTLDGNNAPNIYVSYSWMYGRENYSAVFEHAEDLSDPALNLDLDCIRPNILLNTSDGKLPMVPIFSTTQGMLVNNDLFEREGLEVPTTYTELVSVCNELRAKGYESPMLAYNREASSSMFYILAYPLFCYTIADDATAAEKLNALDPSAGEYMRPALEMIAQYMQDGCIDLAACEQISGSYEPVILRFLEGDAPMMICTGDTVSGTQKRESMSEAFTENPFTYSFVPIPVTEEGAIFADISNLQFSVNKDCSDLEMTNEFMRFLITSQELNEMAQIKRLVTPTKDLSFDSVYAPFGTIPSERIVSPGEIGILDAAVAQFRYAAHAVGTGAMTVDEAIANYGKF